ncbi:eukaryotic translation initiation factor 3 subunit A [Nilaparvata lugens]|uniref:eukaryotic translation initiation factor 3 subunit A n=1 Tax=Nilaparvata lugens TaxID=108931 RepID=UPI00193CF362|nr:eukaryotic translation initiation factor 3 subunit A [Nilaparvata lugens]
MNSAENELSLIESCKKLRQNEMKLEELSKNLEIELNELNSEKKILVEKIEKAKEQASNNEREMLCIEQKNSSLKEENKKSLDAIMKTAVEVQDLSWKMDWFKIVAENQNEELRKKSEKAQNFKEELIKKIKSSAEPKKEDLNEMAQLEETVKRLQEEKRILESKNLKQMEVLVQQDIDKLEKRNKMLLVRLQRQVAESQKRKQQMMAHLNGLKNAKNT